MCLTASEQEQEQEPEQGRLISPQAQKQLEHKAAFSFIYIIIIIIITLILYFSADYSANALQAVCAENLNFCSTKMKLKVFCEKCQRHFTWIIIIL